MQSLNEERTKKRCGITGNAAVREPASPQVNWTFERKLYNLHGHGLLQLQRRHLEGLVSGNDGGSQVLEPYATVAARAASAKVVVLDKP